MASYNAWDSHIHCFDPGQHPFRPGRAYTPPPASLESYFDENTARHIMLVQASIENGYGGLVDTLARCRKRYDNVVIRGTIAIQTPWEEATPSTYDALHELGVRSIRIHGLYGGPGGDVDGVKTLLRSLSTSYAVQTLGWKLSAQLPLSTWAALRSFLLKDQTLSHLQLIADHNGCATPSDIGSPDLDVFLELLRAKRISVKISALYRRSPDNKDQMQPIIQAFANAAPDGLIWGSDWPHVDSTAGGSGRPPLRGPVDVAEELELLRTWLSEGQWKRMMDDNPRRLFA